MARLLLAVVLLFTGLGLVPGPGLGQAQADLTITEFGATAYPTDVWLLEGYVTGAEPGDTMIYIDGVLGGMWVSVDPDGHFAVDLTVDPNVSGGVSAQAYTWYGDSSVTAETVIN